MINPLTIKTPQGTFAAIPGDYMARDIRPPGPSLPASANPAPSNRLILLGIAALALLLILES